MSEVERIVSEIQDNASAVDPASRSEAAKAETARSWDELAADPTLAAPPERFKPLREMTAADFLELQQTGQRPESDTYRQYRARVLKQAGLPDDTGPKPLRDMTVADHLARIQRRR